MKIACLHTADSNIAVFEEAARTLGILPGALVHEVRTDLLAAAEQAGGLTLPIENETRATLIRLSQSADAVILTCSTLGPVLTCADQIASVPIIRVDAALARQAVAAGGKLVVLCAVATTLQPTLEVFTEAARGHEVSLEVRLIEGAWAMFKTGNLSDYLSLIVQSAHDAYTQDATLVVLAQASMAAAAESVTNGPRPLSSPLAGLSSVLEALA